jgi:hypothetical protein
MANATTKPMIVHSKRTLMTGNVVVTVGGYRSRRECRWVTEATLGRSVPLVEAYT